MKWYTLGLVLLGLAAAFCVAILVASLRSDPVHASILNQVTAPEEVEILIAAKAMPAMRIVDSAGVARRTVLREQAPRGSYSDVVQVAGHVLTMPMVEGQPFTDSCFVTGGSGKHLAAALADGMRAVSVALTSAPGLDGILYPGCIVDVVVTLNLPAKVVGARSRVISKTLLRGVQVLGIADDTVVSPPDEEGLLVDQMRRLKRGEERMITLMLKTKQAELLHLAEEHGSLSLAMRNPLDAAIPDSVGILLSDLSPEYAIDDSPTDDTSSPAAEKTAKPKRGRRWDIVILRGGEIEKRTLSISGLHIGG